MPSLVRAVSWILGIGAIAWSIYFVPMFRENARLHHIASEYLLGRGLPDQILIGGTQPVAWAAQSSFCNPVELHDAVVIRLAVFNDVVNRPASAGWDSAYNSLQEAARRAVSCAPFDSFSWLTLFWLDTAKQGINTENLRYLHLSYALGRYEGWIAVWRSRLAIKGFAELPPDLANEALSEFVTLVDAGYLSSEAATIFTSATPALQQRLLERLKSAKNVERQVFAKTLYDKGFDVNIPDVEKPTRPWN
jgi:hypothetical protein